MGAIFATLFWDIMPYLECIFSLRIETTKSRNRDKVHLQLDTQKQVATPTELGLWNNAQQADGRWRRGAYREATSQALFLIGRHVIQATPNSLNWWKDRGHIYSSGGRTPWFPDVFLWMLPVVSIEMPWPDRSTVLGKVANETSRGSLRVKSGVGNLTNLENPPMKADDLFW